MQNSGVEIYGKAKKGIQTQNQTLLKIRYRPCEQACVPKHVIDKAIDKAKKHR